MSCNQLPAWLVRADHIYHLLLRWVVLGAFAFLAVRCSISLPVDNDTLKLILSAFGGWTLRGACHQHPSGTTPMQVVSVAPDLVQGLKEQFERLRGRSGELAAGAFVALDLPAIVHQLAADFWDLPEIVVGIPTGRRLTFAGITVDHATAYGFLKEDGQGIELTSIVIGA